MRLALILFCYTYTLCNCIEIKIGKRKMECKNQLNLMDMTRITKLSNDSNKVNNRENKNQYYLTNNFTQLSD